MSAGALTRVALISLLFGAAPGFLEGQEVDQPYAGLQEREIKSLSREQIERYRAGEGMGLALPAELNDHPGPKHVLEPAADLELSAEPGAAVQAAYDAMHAEAVRLGEAVVDRERRLDALFAGGAVTSEALRAALDELGRLQAELRFVHLAAHLETQRVLIPEQVERYGRLGATARAPTRTTTTATTATAIARTSGTARWSRECAGVGDERRRGA
jgi:Spy/CpxP family protein refolding chaperone